MATRWEMEHPPEKRIKEGNGAGDQPTVYRIAKVEGGHILQMSNGYWLSLNIEQIQALEEVWGRGTYISQWSWKSHPWVDLAVQVVIERKTSKEGRPFGLLRVKGQPLPNGPQHANAPPQSSFSSPVEDPFATAGAGGSNDAFDAF